MELKESKESFDHPHDVHFNRETARKIHNATPASSSALFSTPFSVPRGSAISVSQDTDGSIYIGQVKNFHRHGKGSAFYANGDFLSGDFRHDAFQEGIQFRNKKISCEALNHSRRDRKNMFFQEEAKEDCISLREGQEAIVSLAASRMYSIFLVLLQVKKEWKCAYTQNFSLQCLFHPLSFINSQFIISTRKPGAQLCDFHEYTRQHLSEFRKGLFFSSPDRNSSFDDAISSSSKKHELRKSVRNGNSESIRDEVAHKAPVEVVFAFACSVSTELFNWSMFLHGFLAFLLPFLALPGFFCSPLAIDASETEREFIVSGASLLRSFNSPYISLYIAGIAVVIEAAAVVVLLVQAISVRTSIGTGDIAIIELLFPIALLILNALVAGSYFGFRRVPHGLEHMNRELSAELTALAANVVDSKSNVCIYTWDEAGREKEKNKWFRLKWMCLSIVIAIAQPLLTIILRIILGFNITKNTFDLKLFISFSYISCFFSLLDISYYTLKALDMQREELSKLHVLSTVAYLEGKSLLNAGVYAQEHFSCNTTVNVTDLKNGFIGWYTTRSLILCASPSANILSRGAAFSVLILAIFLESVTCIIFFFYKRSTSQPTESDYFFILSCSLLYIWGPICIHYLITCASIKNELQRHLYIMDVVGLYHKLHHGDAEGSGIIKKCRRIADAHDISPKLFNFSLNFAISWTVIFCILIAMFLSPISVISL